MSMVARNRPEDVGEILIKVQEDLHQLKGQILAQKTGTIDIAVLENAIQKTEDGIKNKTEAIISQLNNQVITLPSVDGQVPASYPKRTTSHRNVRRLNTQGAMKFSGGNVPAKASESKIRLDLRGPTPGQKTRSTLQGRVITNPYNPRNREMLASDFGVQLPALVQRNTIPDQSNNIIKGSTVDPLAVLPPENRHDPQLLPPAIAEEDADRGILSLMERGLIPPAAELTLDPSPVSHVTAPLHDPAGREQDKFKVPMPDNEDAFRLDDYIPRPMPPTPAVGPVPPPDGQTRKSSSHKTRTATQRALSVRTLHMAVQPMTAGDKPPPTGSPDPRPKIRLPPLRPLTHCDPDKLLIPDGFINQYSSVPGTARTNPEQNPLTASIPVYNPELPVDLRVDQLTKRARPPPTTPASAAEAKDKTHRFAIQHGKTREMSPEFVAFKQHYCLSWGGIVSMLRCLERMLVAYSIPLAFINGDRLADLSLEFELEQPPSVDDLLSVIVNRDDVENLIKRPGRRYLCSDGPGLAAAKIQASWRMYLQRQRYMEHRRKKWAAGVIVISWIMAVKMSKVRKQMKQNLADLTAAFRERRQELSRNWSRIKSSKRVVIHVPSLGYTEKLREGLLEFGQKQNGQMGRLADLADPNVDVIYVSPVPMSDEMKQYYGKLLGLKTAVETGNVDDQTDMSQRYTIVTPEAINRFPAHSMCLMTHLRYSPKALKRIKHLIKGRDAYMVTGVPHRDDLHVANDLGVAVLSAEPEVAKLYSTKSGSKRVFASASVTSPPGEYDVYSLQQLHESLAQLITENLEVTRWLFKLDDEFNGRGIAALDVEQHLPCYKWARKEALRYGEKWNKKWAQEAALIKIQSEIADVLSQHAAPLNTSIYDSWQTYLDIFLSQGGVIEASPPSDSVTAITVDMMIEPDGNIVTVCLGDQIHAESQFSCWGLSVPQCSIEPEILNSACQRVAESCQTRGVVGPITMDFVTFISPKTYDQVLWATDLQLAYSDSAAMFQLLLFITSGSLNREKHLFEIEPPKKEEKKTKRKKKEEEEEDMDNTRYAVMSTKLRHTNLSVVHYSVFFQMCRAHGIGYDIKEKQGSIFTLIDSYNRDNLGMLTVVDNLQGALATFARNLSVIHQEISAPNMQGESNFKPAIEDIESVLGSTVQNAEEADEQARKDKEK